jgi:hypothetical protein
LRSIPNQVIDFRLTAFFTTGAPSYTLRRGSSVFSRRPAAATTNAVISFSNNVWRAPAAPPTPPFLQRVERELCRF